MRGLAATAIFIILAAPTALGKNVRSYNEGKLVSMTSVKCGSKRSSGQSFAGELIGTDSEHTNTQDLLCPEYTVQTDRLIYRIRPKNMKHPVLLPVGEDVDLRVREDKLYVRTLEGDRKEREYKVISIEMRPCAGNAKGAQ